MSLFTYFIVGTLVGFMMEIISKFSEEPNRINMVERLLIIALWPIMLTLFIYHFIKGML
tara:strand:+ start:401 stop:577 length:177 start_codon:yes stop_codon:yes gene_type:complete